VIRDPGVTGKPILATVRIKPQHPPDLGVRAPQHIRRDRNARQHRWRVDAERGRTHAQITRVDRQERLAVLPYNPDGVMANGQGDAGKVEAVDLPAQPPGGGVQLGQVAVGLARDP
jgi:hypothetical protein